MYNQACLPIHFVCLHELREKNKLFLFAHELVEHSPDKAITWFSVGCYNFLIGQNSEARDILPRHLLWILIAGQRGSHLRLFSLVCNIFKPKIFCLLNNIY
ncbi:anaphase-promoting complex subunit Cut9 [Gigaspora margarita]|uniref:Anaphase-promoting complex subunit Cut9 n=2 Tax=Gigaspora margarita TaxID=4874 RepID=A0A8H3X372_GIGMA|nr:anaphase-promoting complex subunit Cut9 [Gigaspora margarita]